MQIADDLKVAILACPAECFIVACLQARPALMKPTNGIQVAALGSLANSSFQSGVFGAPGRSNDGNASQQNTPAIGRHWLVSCARSHYTHSTSEYIFPCITGGDDRGATSLA